MTLTVDDLERWRDEPLNPDLEPYVEESGFLGRCLKHPLVFQIPLSLPGQANEFYAYKVEAMQRAMDEEDWSQTIWLTERPYRLDALSFISDRLDGPTYWSLVQDVWQDTENSWQNKAEWLQALNDDRPGREFFMDVTEQAGFAVLPNTLKVFRGAQRGLNERGFAWTLDEDRARWFAQRFKREAPAVVLHGTVAKSNVLGYLTGRGEDEIVVPNPRKVKIVQKIAA